eukprot:4141390-Pyramimonas_sp.AAC.1
MTGENADEGIGGREGRGKKKGGRRFALRKASQLAPATPTKVNNKFRHGSRHRQRHAPPP